MISRRWENLLRVIIGVVSLCWATSSIGHGNAAVQADSAAPAVAGMILRQTGVTGGLVVHLHCGDGRLTAALRLNDSLLVQGLDTAAENVAAARETVQSAGVYGVVSVRQFDGNQLPYCDNLVNLLVAEQLGETSLKECLRVLAPGGIAFIKQAGQWKKRVKPWPEQFDQWTHHMHDASGNAVSRDRAVGPPTQLRWTAGPRWARSHGWTPSVSAMVSANGRLFYICDETLNGASEAAASKWNLVARDAFSGVLLWKRPVSPWGAESLSGTPDSGKGVTTGRFTMPPNAGKRLVAVGDRVFVTLGAAAPVTALNAATGETVFVCRDTERADEILYSDDRLIVSICPARKMFERAPAKRVCAVDAANGKLLWKRGPFSGIRATKGQDPFGRLELCAGDGKVFTLTTETIECLDGDTGETVWRRPRPELPDDAVRKIGFAGMYEYQLTVMLYQDGVVLLAQPEPNTHHTYHTMPGTLHAFAAKDGRPLWKHGYGGWGHCTPPDVFVAQGKVWTHVDVPTEYGFVWGKGFKAADSSLVDYRIQSLDLHSGEVLSELLTKEIFNVGHHHRCYRNKSTERFLMSSRRGVEFVDLSSGENYQNHWVRSGCLLGYVPSNGLLYVTPHPCGCYLNAKLTGFNALASTGLKEPRIVTEGELSNASERLQLGAAFLPESAGDVTDDRGRAWPTYRHDAQRSGATETAVGHELHLAWRADIGSQPSAPIVADGLVFTASIDTHTVCALDVVNGNEAWRHTVGGRVDSPPTFYRGVVIFGSADGQVHCLRARDGALVWRFNAAPQRRLVTAFGQLESPWPVPGSVLIQDDKCWFAAGRSSYLDGGIVVYALDPISGRVVHEQTIYSPDPSTGKMPPEVDGQQMAGLLNDIPSSDGANVFIRQMSVGAVEGLSTDRVYTSGGYLDPSWFNRTFWQAGGAETTGLMVLGEGSVFGVEAYAARNRDTLLVPGTRSYRLQCFSSGSAPETTNRRKGRKPQWERRLGVRVDAMLRANDVLFVAGSPDIVDPDDPNAAWEGRKGGVVAAFAAKDGQPLGEFELAAPPVWDGMAAAEGRLFLSTRNGQVVCLMGAGRQVN